jgi:hypothetical protein
LKRLGASWPGRVMARVRAWSIRVAEPPTGGEAYTPC